MSKTVQPRTLRLAMVEAGFDRAKDLVDAARVPRTAVSQMLAGGLSYPKARHNVAHALKITEDELFALIGASGEAARRKVAAG